MLRFEFDAVIKKHERINSGFVELPFNVKKEFGKSRVKVKALIDGKEYRGSVSKMGLDFYWLIITQEIRKATGKNPGDRVYVVIEEDREERRVEIPYDFVKEMNKTKGIMEYFEKLPYTHRKEYINWITEAKKPETRKKRLTKAVEMLRAKAKSILTFTIFLSLSIASCNPGKIQKSNAFYLSPYGNDENPGTSRKPWKTLEKVNGLRLTSGDRILLEGGQVFPGTLRLDSLDNGSKENKILITSYGNGSAIIDGGSGEGIVISGSSNFIVRQINIKGNGRKTGNYSSGLKISSSSDFETDSLEVYGFQHSGVEINGSKNARITRVNAHDNGFAGIYVTGPNVNHPVTYDNENLYIGYSTAFNNPGDPEVLKNHSGNGILAASVKGGVIEYCEAYNNGWDMPWTGNGPVGIWIWDCTDFKIQYSVSHHNKTNPAAADGGGFDLDGGVSGSVIQYCISYCNQGSGFGLFEFGASKPWENNIIRYNISYNDASLNGGSLGIWKGENGGAMRNCEIHNNTFYNDTVKGISVWLYNSMHGFIFRNNYFIFSGTFLGKGQEVVNELFENNWFWNLDKSKVILPGMTENNNSGAVYKNPGLNNLEELIIDDPTKIDIINKWLPVPIQKPVK